MLKNRYHNSQEGFLNLTGDLVSLPVYCTDIGAQYHKQGGSRHEGVVATAGEVQGPHGMAQWARCGPQALCLTHVTYGLAL